MSPVLKYGIISDTHGALPETIFDVFDGVEMIFHCGDLGDKAVEADLEAIAPLCAVRGNMDPWPLHSVLPGVHQENLPFGKIIITHGNDYGYDSQSIMHNLLKHFRQDMPRVILYGHTHEPRAEMHKGILIINPGSAGMPRGGHRPSVAILTYDVDRDILQSDFVLV